MQVYEDLEAFKPERDTIITMGSFDGVHRGHKYLLSRVVAHGRAMGFLSLVLTFFPHPRVVLYPEQGTQYLCTRWERQERLAALGVETTIVLPFTGEVASLSAEEFLRLLLQLRMREFWVGTGFSMGRGREGTTARLRVLAKDMGFHLEVVPPFRDGGEGISSTRIRQLLAVGDVGEAARLLGRRVSFTGRVVPGAHRGKSLGFPTANIPLDPTLAVPQDGVYAVWASVDGQRYPGVANLGGSPSFMRNDRLLEVHLIGLGGELYGQQLTVEFVRRLRPVCLFHDREALTRQIAADVDTAVRLLAGAREV